MTPEAAQQLAADWARTGGYTLTPEALATITDQIATTLNRDANGFTYRDEVFNETFNVENGVTVAVPVGEWVAGLMQRHGKPVPKATTADAQASPAPAIPSSAPEWAQRTRGPISDFARALAASEDAAIQREIAGWPNPWAKGQENRTRQAITSNRNPALAARHKAQAGA